MAAEDIRGGPKSVTGKARSSKNATSHGLTAMTPVGSAEKKLVEDFSRELSAYYKPQSPLEILQIERIAICRAKLQHLYDLERVKLELAAKELEAQPEKIIEKIPGVEGVVKAMMLELIEHGQIQLPCKLDVNLLSHVCLEIVQFSGGVGNQHQFARTFPKLTKYLNSFDVAGFDNTNQWMQKLESVSNRLQTLLSFGDNYFGRKEELMYYYGLGKDYEYEQEKKERNEALKELDRYQEEVVRPRHNLKPRPTIVESPKVFEFPAEEVLRSQLGCFISLYKSHEQAVRHFEHYQEIRVLMVRSISLSTSESDLLMRYQTTLERRLSSAIGELLALQRALPRSSA
jgi:hypothetical protein